MNHSELLSSFSTQMADAVEHASKSLVTVNGRERQAATGIVYANELVLTADHVVERDDNLTIETADGKKHAAQLVGRDSSTDLAVLRVAGLAADGFAAGATARVGQLILAVGRPSNEGVAASSGVVSAVGGPIRGNGVNLEKYIRTDATPYPGFSGGALIDSSGAVVAVLTTGLARGATLGIPIEIALRVAGTLTNQGYVKRGYLGVISQQVKLPSNQRAGQTQEQGLLVMRVEDNSPAQHANIFMGDILVSIDGNAIHTADDLLAMLNGERVGKPVNVGVIRGGSYQTISVIVGQRN